MSNKKPAKKKRVVAIKCGTCGYASLIDDEFIKRSREQGAICWPCASKLPPTPMQVCHALSNRASIETPEKRLLFAVLSSSILDLANTNKTNALSARSFLHSRGMEELCGWIDLHPDFVRSMVGRYIKPRFAFRPLP